MTENWHDWDHAAMVIFEEVMPHTFNNSARARLLYQWKTYCEIGGYRLLAANELPEKGKEGFRLRHGQTKNQHVDIVRRKDGSIYIKSTVTDANCEFEASITEPSAKMTEQFEAALEYLVAFGDFGKDF